MKTKLTLKQVGLIVSLLCNAISGYASHDNRSIFWCHPQASQNPKIAQEGGTFQLRLAIEPVRDTTITEVRLEISKTFNLTYNGPTEIIRRVISRTDSMIFELSLVLPDNDTAGIECWFWATPNKGESGFSRYWITNPNKPEQFGADPRYLLDFYDQHHPPGVDYTYTKDSIEARMARIKPSTTYNDNFTDDKGNKISEEQWRRSAIAKIAVDSGWLPVDYDTTDERVRQILNMPGDREAWLRQQKAHDDSARAARKLTPRQEMEELEKTPLNGLLQNIYVDGVLYTRTSGETKFRVAENQPTDGDYTNVDFQQDRRVYQDSVLQADTSSVYRIILDLRNPEHFRAAESLNVPLTPADSVGFYKVEIKKPVYERLVKQLGIPAHYLRIGANQDSTTFDEGKKKDNR